MKQSAVMPTFALFEFLVSTIGISLSHCSPSKPQHKATFTDNKDNAEYQKDYVSNC